MSSKEEIPWGKDPIFYAKQQPTTKKAFDFQTFCSTSLLFHQNSFYLPLINKFLLHHSFVQSVYCSSLPSSYHSFVLPTYCSTLLLFYPSTVPPFIVWSFFCSTFLLFCSFIVISTYCSTCLLLYHSIVLTLCWSTLLLSNCSTTSHKKNFVFNAYCANTPWSSVNPRSRSQLKQKICINKHEDTILLDHVTLSQEHHTVQN